MSLPAQPDLFGDDQREADRILAGGLTVLADVHPNTLAILIGRRRPDTGEIKQGLSGAWAYSVRRPGLYYQDRATWAAQPGAWYRRPANLLTWDALDAAITPDPRLDALRAWADSLTAIDSWRDLHRPFELWPDPETWHPSYIRGDHERPGWQQRITAWRTALQLCVDARPVPC